ncbi:Swt1 family HEPN domain-containing protein [Tabrizicola sp.]|uniref:Swt1 family HEPN domain-containing protein n=1 Tax=Tabrizicola sp. TaxID=2005166 RepID=UPI003D2A63EB
MFRDLREHSSYGSGRDNRSELERYTDALVDRHLEQIDPSIQADAQKMGEFYRMFYALENDIRDMIAAAMEAEFGESWWGEKVPSAVRDNVKSNKAKEDKEGIPPRSRRRIDYTSFGELGEVIKANWEVFRGIFSNASIERVERVIHRLNLARGPIAHSGIVPPEESVRLKLAIRDWYALME